MWIAEGLELWCYCRPLMKRRWLPFALLLIFPCLGDHLSAQSDGTIGDLLDRYGRGDVAAVTSALESIQDFKSALKQLDKAALPWIRAEGPQAVPRRRLVAAGFALELAHAGLDHWEEARNIVEWGCVLLRAGGLPTPPERAWHLAALALAQGARDADFLTNPAQFRSGAPKALDHLRHSIFRFPDDARFLLARTVTDEFRTLGSDPKHPEIATEEGGYAALSRRPYADAGEPTPVEVFDRTTAQQMMSVAGRTHRRVPFSARRSLWLWDLADQWKALAEQDAIRVEANVRLANTYLRLARPELALAALQEGPALRPDPFTRYLECFLAGRAHGTLGDRPAAEKDYRSATAVVPGAQSATVALAALLFTSDSRDEAFEIMETAFSMAVPVRDPWREYQAGDFRLWPQRLAGLRESYRP